MSRKSSSSRRDFLKTTGAASALALGSAPLATRIPRGPNEAIGVAVIGVGGMGSAHAQSLVGLAKSKQENLRLIACADVCKPRLDRCVDKTSESQGGEKVVAYRDYQELLARKDVDAVWIASPEHWHAQMAIDAVAAGKDVYVEKPMTLNLEDAIRLQHVANVTDRIIEVGTQFVTDAKYDKAAELIKSGAIGQPTSSVTGYCRNSPKGEWNYYAIEDGVEPGPNLDWDAWCGPLGKRPFDPKVYARWRRYKTFSTGIIGDLLVHVTTPLVNAIDQGWPVRVVATGSHLVDKDMENFDQVTLLVEFESGHQMTIFGSTCNANTPAPLIRGHKANLQLSGNNCQLVPEGPYAEDVDRSEFRSEGQSQDRLRLDLLKCVRERKAPLSPVSLGMRIMVIVDLAARSMWEGKAFRFDPKYMTASAI